MVMTAVLTTYVSLGRNFTRSLGLTSSNQPNLESQIRRTITTFSQDVRMANGIPSSSTLSASRVTLTLPTGNSTNQITYYYNSTAITSSANSDAVTINGTSITMRREALTRCVYDGTTVTSLVLHTNLLSCVFNYYDSSGNPDTDYVNYRTGIKQISLTITAQGGRSTNGTLTPVYKSDSSRLLLRNKPLLQ